MINNELPSSTYSPAYKYAPRFDTQQSFDEKHQDYLNREDIYAQNEGIVSRRNLADRFSLYKRWD